MKPSIICSMIIVVALSGCSVVMAAKGSHPPDLSQVRKGASRAEIELALGAAESTFRHERGSTSIYQFEADNEPSPGRAVAHGAMDVFTFGIWEAIGTPIELSMGQTQVLVIEFDQADRVVSISKSAPKK